MKKSGIYKIWFIGNKKVYIGSTVDISKRKYEHKRTLTKNEHANMYLQRAFNKYGQERYRFEVLEYYDDIPTLREIEQKWVNFYNSANKNMGYNIVPEVNKAGTTGMKFTKERLKRHQKTLHKMWNLRKKKYKFISPDGKIVEIFGLNNFCKTHGLHARTMYNVHNGIGHECMGWKKYYKNGFFSRRKGGDYILIKDKVKIKCNNLSLFCKENNLSYDLLRNGKTSEGYQIYKKCGSHRRNHFTIMDKDNNKIEIDNLSLFCREHNINYCNFCYRKKENGYLLIS